jgi:tetratricopeptide (TPR) repeat protein
LDAIEIDPDNPDAYYSLALAYFMSDQFIKFKTNLEKAQRLYRQEGDEDGLKKVEVYGQNQRTRN